MLSNLLFVLRKNILLQIKPNKACINRCFWFIITLLKTNKFFISKKGKSMLDLNMLDPKKPNIIVDSDQVVTDFNLKTAMVYFSLFGKMPEIVNKKAFRARNVYDFSTLTPKQIELFIEKTNDHDFWSNMSAMPDAVWFINKLSENFNVIILTSMNEKFENGRAENLKALGMNVSAVCAVSSGGDRFNPKEEIARQANAVFFVDDLIKNFKGLSDLDTKLIYLDHGYSDHPDAKYQDVQFDHKENNLVDIYYNIIKPYVEQHCLV